MTIPVASATAESPRLLICFSHLRWDFVHQRPQHLLTRAARDHRVVYFEEPLFEAIDNTPRLRLRDDASGVTVATPILPEAATTDVIRALIDQLIGGLRRTELITWYYTPMALAFSAHLEPDVCVYDCMDELAAFQNPPPGLRRYEELLFERADLVFTGGYSLYEVKRRQHPRVYAFPSSVDAAHFRQARAGRPDPADQCSVPHPRIGFFGVIDERMDLALVAHAAAEMPDVEFIMLGPVAKIDPAILPRSANLHWLGGKGYGDLPEYLANWTAGWMPFALNPATRFISPTKTPEFLAAGLPLTSTAVPDVLRGYAGNGLVAIADRASIVATLRASLRPPEPAWLARVDKHLAAQSWDMTWTAMRDHLRRARMAPVEVLQRKGA
ncbi:MAG: glycosyltransferase family 1 protein [Rhodobacteraceae bacterium]|nr:glycosyltransferase family 1 protein [Paracoccaceae bacterium]